MIATPDFTRTIAPVEANASHAAQRGLDFLSLFVANIQTGFGPFISVYLTTQGWTQTSIGVALSIGTVVAMLSQIPAGAVVDRIRRKSLIAAASLICFAGCALSFAILPVPLFVYGAEILHGFASCLLGPVIAAMSLAVSRPAEIGQRLGRNARYASIGNGVAAGLMGFCSHYLSTRAVFFLTAGLTLPALGAIIPLSALDRTETHRSPPKRPTAIQTEAWRHVVSTVLTDRRLVIFSGCAMLFMLSNAAMLPLIGSMLTKRAQSEPGLLIAACIVLPQIIVALSSPMLGRVAETHGRRIVLACGFATLPLRGLLFAVTANPGAIIAVQSLDGLAAASFGVMMPLIVSDIAGRSGHFNLALGVVGFAIGLGATSSTTLAGWLTDRMGDGFAFFILALIGLAATLAAALIMPETRPSQRRTAATSTELV